MTTANSGDRQDQFNTARRALLTGGAMGLAAVAGATLGGAQPASAQTNPSITDWINVVTDVSPGADPTGATDSTSAVVAAIALVPNGGVVYFPAGIYKIAQGGQVVVKVKAPVYLIGAGRQATQINFADPSGGDCIRMYNNYVPSGGPTSIAVWGGGVADLTIDGTSAGSGATGLHIGDMKRAKIACNIQNFTGTGDIGLHLDNQKFWTEQASVDVELINNTTGCQFDCSGTGNTSTGAFDNGEFKLGIDAVPGQTGVSLVNGANPYHSQIWIHGGVGTGSSAGTCLNISGSVPAGHPGAGNSSTISHCRLDIQVETNGSGTVPKTIAQGSAGNVINGCYGILHFMNGPWTPSDITPDSSNGQFFYFGIVKGDTNLNPANNDTLVSVGANIGFAAQLQASGTFQPQQGDYFSLTLSQNTTIAPSTNNPAFAGPQRKTFVLTQATGTGPFTVAWSSSVAWPSGVTPIMPTAAGAMMVVELTTIDGSTWYGNAVPATVPGQYLCPPTSYAPATLQSLTVTSTSYTAISSANINTGSFYAPPSGSAVVTATVAAQQSAAGNVLGFALVAHGTSTVTGNAIQVDAQAATSIAAYTLPFVLTGLTPGKSYNFDLAAASPSGTITVHAYGTSSATSTRGGPATMTVQAV